MQGKENFFKVLPSDSNGALFFLIIDDHLADAYLLNPNFTLASPGCNEAITIPPYAVGTPLNETYPGCDVNPQGLINLNTTTGNVLYPTIVTADGHTATWTVRDLCFLDIFCVRL
jgi:hypothetical protein